MTTEFAIDILPSQGMLPDDRPETAVAGLPTTLIVAGRFDPAGSRAVKGSA